MAIDASIYSQIQQPQAQNPLASLAQAYQIKAYQGALDKSDRETASQNRLAELARQSFNPETGAIDANKMRAGLAQAGDFGALTTFEKTQADQAKATREANKAKLEEGLKHFEVVGQIMNGVRDQASLDLARQQAAQIFGADAAQNIPRVYDPQVIAQNQARAMSVKDQLEQQYKALTFGGTQRHNQATEGLTASGQAVTQRGQDMTASTAKAGQDITVRGQDLTNQRALDAKEDKPLNDTQSKALQFGARMQQSGEILNNLAESGGPTQPGLIKRAADLLGPTAGTIANVTQSAGQQQVEQAQRDFINAALRRESGASISPAEFSNAERQYFPQPGDSKEVLAQKRANRELATKGILAEVPKADERVAAIRGSSAPKQETPAKVAPVKTKVVGGKTYFNDGKGWYTE